MAGGAIVLSRHLHQAVLLFLFTLLNGPIGLGQGGTVANGQVVIGTMSAPTNDVWTFNTPGGAAGTNHVTYCATVTNLTPARPGYSGVSFSLANDVQIQCSGSNTATRSVTVHGTGAGSYLLQVVTSISPVIPSASSALLYNDVPHTGTLVANEMEILEVAAAPGGRLHFSGSTSAYGMQIDVLQPGVSTSALPFASSNVFAGGAINYTSAAVPAGKGGLYRVLVTTYNSTPAATTPPNTPYTLTVSGASISPTLAKTDGIFCERSVEP